MCTPIGGGTAISATGQAEPATKFLPSILVELKFVEDYIGGQGYECVSRATNIKGEGKASNPAFAYISPPSAPTITNITLDPNEATLYVDVMKPSTNGNQGEQAGTRVLARPCVHGAARVNETDAASEYSPRSLCYQPSPATAWLVWPMTARTSLPLASPAKSMHPAR